MRNHCYESPTIVILALTSTDILTSSFGGNTPIEDEDW